MRYNRCSGRIRGVEHRRTALRQCTAVRRNHAWTAWRDRDDASSKIVLQLGLAVIAIFLLTLFQSQLGPLKARLLQRQSSHISQEFLYGEPSEAETQHIHDFVYLPEQRHWCHCGLIESCVDGEDPDRACDVCGHVQQ